MPQRKRPLDENLDPHKKPHHGRGTFSRSRSPAAVASPPQAGRRRPSFPSYLDAPGDLPPKIRLLCEILAKTPSPSVEHALDDAGVRITPDDVEEVLKLSYGSPGPAVKFFRWAGAVLHHRHSPYAWNLVVDLLGRNLLFDAMWDAIKSMRSERLLSLATFASVFGSYAAAGRPDEALMTFEVMDQYDVPCDVAALNSLLSAVCREGQTARARELLARVATARGGRILPDADTYAILLEGWENEGNVQGAMETFEEMVVRVGWDPANVPAYDSFLSTMVKSGGSRGVDDAIRHLRMMRQQRCSPGMKFFRSTLDEMAKADNFWGATAIWDAMSGRNGCYPDTQMYNTMITLHCQLNQTDIAQNFVDEMVKYGAFPDSTTYNVMLQFLLKGRKLRDARVIFHEMVKNECCPTHDNCVSALRIFLVPGEEEVAVKVWKCMVKNGLDPLEEGGNMLVNRLREMDKLPEACRYAEDMAERGIKLNSKTLSKLRSDLSKLGKGALYDQILTKWKASPGNKSSVASL